VKTQIKHLEETLTKGDVAAAQDQLKLVAQKLDKVASTSTMHKKTAARKKSRLARRVNALKAKQTAAPRPA
jgi:small subunit ribosomal protein S20